MRSVVLLMCLLFVATVSFAATTMTIPRYAATAVMGTIYNPERIETLMVQGQIRMPYDQVFWHQAPETLFFKGEASAGMTLDGRQRAMLAVQMMAQYFFPEIRLGLWRPYVEGGIGVIYTDFRVEEQGLRFNFKSQVGVGVERPLMNGRSLSAGVRLFHISNGGVHPDNRGLDGLSALIGMHF